MQNKDPRVPLDSSNTCWRMAERVLERTRRARSRVRIEIEKRLPVQGGLGAASSNAVATMIALELALKKKLSGARRLRIAAEVGSDLPLFLVGGTVLGVGRGEEVYPLADLPAVAMVVVTPEVGVSTPQAFADWDALVARGRAALGWADECVRYATWTGGEPDPVCTTRGAIDAVASGSDRLFEVGCALSAWLSGLTSILVTPTPVLPQKAGAGPGTCFSDLVRTGIENDFEKVVFPQYPELRDIKGALERAGSRYASLSGSGSTLYGLFRSAAEAAKAAGRLRKQGSRRWRPVR